MTGKANDAIADAIANAPTWAALATTLGVPGKRLRDVARGVFGTYKSRDAEGFNTRTRAFVAAYMLAPAGDTRKGIVQAFKDGADLPPVK
jgi:hypothetical protein